MMLVSFHCGCISSLSEVVQISLWNLEHYVLPPARVSAIGILS
jgi:hypothetical protein